MGEPAAILFSQDCPSDDDKDKIRNFVPVSQQSLEKWRKK